MTTMNVMRRCFFLTLATTIILLIIYVFMGSNNFIGNLIFQLFEISGTKQERIGVLEMLIFSGSVWIVFSIIFSIQRFQEFQGHRTK